MRRLPQRLALGLMAAAFGGVAAAAAGPDIAKPIVAKPIVAKSIVAKSEGGHFVLRVSGIDTPEPINHLHGLDLALAAPDGTPVDGARITLTGKRQFAPNPLPTLPQVAPAPGPGNYRVEGLRFHMPGDWHLVFDIETAQIHDRATLDVVVK